MSAVSEREEVLVGPELNGNGAVDSGEEQPVSANIIVT